ncbi:CERS4-like protein, partial [Mya arenaria]
MAEKTKGNGFSITYRQVCGMQDFTQMAVHHVATLVLIYFSWMMNLFRIGTLVLLLHDAADPILAVCTITTSN